MLNFELYNPVKLIFGKGEIEKLSTLIPKESKILVAYGGGSIFKNGIYDQVKKALEGFNVVEFGGIEANPYYETLMKAVEIIREQRIDFILAVGGGSVIDGTEVLAIFLSRKFSLTICDVLILINLISQFMLHLLIPTVMIANFNHRR